MAACRKASLKVSRSACLLLAKVGPQPLLEQAAGLLQHDFELLYRSGAKDFIESIAGFALLQLLECRLQGIDAADEEIRVDRHWPIRPPQPPGSWGSLPMAASGWAGSVWLLKGWHSFPKVSSLIPGQWSRRTSGVISPMRSFSSWRIRLIASGSASIRGFTRSSATTYKPSCNSASGTRLF